MERSRYGGVQAEEKRGNCESRERKELLGAGMSRPRFFVAFRGSLWPSLGAVQVFLNGRLVPEEQAVVSVFDRGFLYGDGIFETMRILNGKPFRWKQHWERFENGAAFLKIASPFSSEALRDFANRLVLENQMPDSLLRLTLSRGIGIRGYSPRAAERPEQTVGWRLIIAPVTLPEQEPLAQFKTCNKLPQIIARARADALGADEALLLNTDDCLVESSSGNLFWLEQEVVCTPPLASGVLPGVTRGVIFEICSGMGMAVREAKVRAPDFYQKSGVFLSLSSVGIAEGLSLDGKPLARSPIVEKLNKRYWDLVRTETA